MKKMMKEICISNFTFCEIEDIDKVNPDSEKSLERRVFNEVDGDEQKFINIMTLLSAYYGDVVLNVISKWSR